MSSQLNPGDVRRLLRFLDEREQAGDKSFQIDGIDKETMALMLAACERQDGTYNIDPKAHTMERVVRSPRPPARRAVPVKVPGRIQTSARSPRRRSIRSSRAKARAPGGSDDADRHLAPALRAISLGAFRRELERAGL